MSDSMGMQLRISGDASGLTATLLDAKGSVVEAAKVLEGALAPAAAQAQASIRSLATTADRGFSEFKQGVSQSRATAMFFTQALGEFGPAGRTAQLALSGVGSMLMGGGIVGLGLAAAQVGVRLLADAWGESAEEAKKAADAAAAASSKIQAETTAAWDAVAAAKIKAVGGTGAMEFMRSKVNPAQDELAAAERNLAANAADLALWDAGMAYENGGLVAIARSRLEALGDYNAAEKRYQDVKGKLEALKAQAAGIVQAEEATVSGKTGADAEKAAKDKREKDRKEELARDAAQKKQLLDSAIDQHKAEYDAEVKAQLDDISLQSTAMAIIEEREKKEADRRLKVQEEFAKNMEPVTNSIQAAFAGMVQGTMSVGEAIKSVLSSALQSFVDVALKQVFANAAVAGSGAAASQAPVPFIGPALAAAAMASVMGMVLGLTSMISASGGADIGNYAPLAQLHPNEMVLPAHIADPLRDSLASGGLGRSPIVINISSPDARGVRRLLLDNPAAVAEAVNAAFRVRRGRGRG